MIEDRLKALSELRQVVVSRVTALLDEFHTRGYSDTIWPKEVCQLALDGFQDHESQLEGLSALYNIGCEGYRSERDKFYAAIDEAMSIWLSRTWCHKSQNKEKLSNLIFYLVSLSGGKVYLSQVPGLLYRVYYEILLTKGTSILDLIWHAKEPHPNSIQLSCKQIELIMPNLECMMTLSSPSMRSSYLATKEKNKRIAKYLDCSFGSTISDSIRTAFNHSKSCEITESIPVELWRRGYRPEGNRLMLEEAFLWDRRGNFSGVQVSRPSQILDIYNKQED